MLPILGKLTVPICTGLQNLYCGSDIWEVSEDHPILEACDLTWEFAFPQILCIKADFYGRYVVQTSNNIVGSELHVHCE
jgi:hypothetical protein